MSADFVSLAQALCYLKKPSPILDEPSFRATKSAKSMPKDAALRAALVGAMLRGELAHKATLSVMDWQYDLDYKGGQTRKEAELLVVKQDYRVPSDLWHVDNVNFYMSFLSLDEWLTGFKLSRDDFEDNPWMRVTDIRVNTAELEKLAGAMGPVAASARGGRPANMVFWRELYADIVAKVAKAGKPLDDDAEWRAWINELRSEYTDVDESQIEKAMRSLREDLRKRNCLKAGFTRSP